VRQLKDNKRVGLFAKLGRKFDPKLARELAPAEPRIERALYIRWVNAVFTLWQHKVADRLDLSRQDGQRTDATPRILLDIDWDTLVDESGLKDVLDKIARSMNGRTSSYFEKILRTNPPPIGDIAQRIAAFRKANIELVKNAGHDMVADLNETLADANAKGERHEVIAKRIQERTGVGASRAKLIARDQTLKYNASVQQAQAEAAGVNEYTWSTSHDGAVRPMHKALEGKRFSYDDPPVTNEDGDRNAPGEDYNCRCVAVPYISLFEGID
jgi:SPP1 gp7 family putative phage head morphogenesis protein